MKKESLLKVFFFHCILAMIIVPFKVKALSYVNLTPGAAFDYFSDLQEPYHTGSNMPEPYYRIKSNNDTYYAQFLQKNDTYISEKSGFTYGNVSLCDGEPVLLVNYFYINSNTDFYKNAHVYLSQDNKLSLCSTTFDESNGLLEYKCNTNYLKNSTFEIYMTNLDYSLFASYNVENQIYTYKSFQVTCNPSTSSVIDNQNQNKNDIINNQNQNKEDIMNSISGATGSVIGNQNQNTQDIINNQNQNNQQIIENNNQNFDDLNQNIKDQFNECHMEGGKNLFHGSKTITQNGFTTVIDGSHIKISGTSTTNNDLYIVGVSDIGVELEPGTYTVSIKSNVDSSILQNMNFYFYHRDSSGNLSSFHNNNLNFSLPIGRTFTITEKKKILLTLVLKKSSGQTFNNMDIGLQIEKGSSATSFEEYGEEHEVCSNKMDQTNEKLDETNKQLGDLNNNLTNDNVDDASSSANDFFTGFESDDFGLTAIITAPLNFIKSITSSTCTPLGFNAPFVNQRVELPCMGAIYKEHFGSFLTLYQTITFGIVAYWVCVNTLASVRGFKDPDSDRIEVLDL